MAAPLAPWLSTNTPELFLKAQQAGSQVGLGIAEARAKALQAAQANAARYAEIAAQQNAAAARIAQEADAQAARRWEFEQNLRQKALEQSAESERAAATLAATERYRNASLAQDEAQQASLDRYRLANAAKDMAQQDLERAKLAETIRYHNKPPAEKVTPMDYTTQVTDVPMEKPHPAIPEQLPETRYLWPEVLGKNTFSDYLYPDVKYQPAQPASAGHPAYRETRRVPVVPPTPTAAAAAPRQLTPDLARLYLDQANGNRSLAEQMARDDGFTWPTQ